MEVLGRRLVLARSDLRQFASQPPRRGQQEVSRAASRVANRHREDRLLLRILLLRLFQPVFHHRHQSAFDQPTHQLGVGVVRASGLALAAGRQRERHPFRLRLDDRLLVEQALVHRAQLFHIQVLVVDAAPRTIFAEQ